MTEKPQTDQRDDAKQARIESLYQLTNDEFLDFLRVDDDECILEIGCGTGELTRDVARSLSGSVVVGIERSIASVRPPQPGPKMVYFVQGDALELPFADKTFDVVYCRFLLEHVPSPQSALREIKRILNWGGEFYVQENNVLANVFDPECPHFTRVWKQFALLQQHLGGDPLVGSKLFSLLTAAGFRDIELSIQPELHYAGRKSFRPWVENLIMNIRGAQAALIERGLTSEDEIGTACDELDRFMEREDASTIFYWNRARARK